MAHLVSADTAGDLPEVAGDADTVPREFAGAIPGHLHRLDSVAERKELFMQFLLPLILRTNDAIAEDRQAILALCDRWHANDLGLTPRDHFWLARMAARYGASRADAEALLHHVVSFRPPLPWPKR